MKNKYRKLTAILALGVVSMTAACSANPEQVTLTLLAYESFTPTAGIFDAFTAATGVKVNIVLGGDAGEVVTKAALTAGNPEGDVLWGVDNTLLSRALEAKLFAPYQSKNLALLDPSSVLGIPAYEVTPVDTGDVCINYDIAYFKSRKLAPPLSLKALTSGLYRDQLVVPSPLSSSPGLAFLLATIAEFGPNGWQDYWKQLRANGVLVVDGWTEAYTVEFSGSSGKGTRPLVVSYASSPPPKFFTPILPSPRRQQRLHRKPAFGKSNMRAFCAALNTKMRPAC